TLRSKLSCEGTSLWQGYNGERPPMKNPPGGEGSENTGSRNGLRRRVADLGEVGGPADALLLVLLEPRNPGLRNARPGLPGGDDPDRLRDVVLIPFRDDGGHR